MSLKSLLSSAAFAALVSVGSAQAAVVPISVGSGWHEFSFFGVGTDWTNSFSFTLTGSAILRVQDAGLSGDRFEVQQLSPGFAVLGQTSAPTQGRSVNGDYDAAFADPFFSKASFLLGPGTYEIGGTTVESPFGGGVFAAVSLTAAVPEPSTWAMMLIGFAGLAFASRRRQATAAA